MAFLINVICFLNLPFLTYCDSNPISNQEEIISEPASYDPVVGAALFSTIVLLWCVPIWFPLVVSAFSGSAASSSVAKTTLPPYDSSMLGGIDPLLTNIQYITVRNQNIEGIPLPNYSTHFLGSLNLDAVVTYLGKGKELLSRFPTSDTFSSVIVRPADDRTINSMFALPEQIPVQLRLPFQVDGKWLNLVADDLITVPVLRECNGQYVKYTVEQLLPIIQQMAQGAYAENYIALSEKLCLIGTFLAQTPPHSGM